MNRLKGIRFQKGILLATLMAGIMSYRAAAQIYVNPLLGNIDVHDPSGIIKEGNTYYVFYTGNLVGRKTSTDRITWTDVGSTISNPGWYPTYVPGFSGGGVWAPDISYRSGKYWLYYAVSTFGSNTSAIGLATSPTLNPAQWTDQGMVIRSVSGNSYNCIDPNAFQDSDGSVWLVFGSFWSGIKLVKLDSLTGKPATSTPTLTSLATRTSTSLGIEAPFIIKRGTYYYLFVSWDICCQGVKSTYNIRFGRSTAVTGPYSDQSGVAMSAGGGTLLWSGDARWKGPGGQSLFTDNDTVFLVCHSYDSLANGQSKLIIRPLYWISSGWPTLTPTSETVLREEGDIGQYGGPNAVFLTTGNRFSVPEKVRRMFSMCGVYTLQGKNLFRAPADRIVDLKEYVGDVQGAYIVRFYHPRQRE